MKFVLITFCNFYFRSDPAMKQFLIHLSETKALGRKFVRSDLDDQHIFIDAEIVPMLRTRIDDLMDSLSFPMTDKT